MSIAVKALKEVEALLPQPHEDFAHPADLYRRHGLGAIGSLRIALRKLEASGHAQSILIMNSKQRMPMRLYRRAGE
jgi:hypothetical protein